MVEAKAMCEVENVDSGGEETVSGVKGYINIHNVFSNPTPRNMETIKMNGGRN